MSIDNLFHFEGKSIPEKHALRHPVGSPEFIENKEVTADKI